MPDFLDFAALIGSLRHLSPREIAQEVCRHRGKLVPSKKESQGLLHDAIEAIEGRRLTDAATLLYFGLVLDEAYFLSELQKSGGLRASRARYDTNPLTSIVSSLSADGLGLSDTVSDYLRSVSNIYRIAQDVAVEVESLRNWLATEREVGIHGAVATLDYVFLSRTIEYRSSNPALPSRDPSFFSAEQLSDGLSTILAIYFQEFGPLTKNSRINTDSAVEGKYFDALVSGTHIAQFREWEFLIDRFHYRLAGTSTSNTFQLTPPSLDFLRALEYGYIGDFMQRCAKKQEWQDPAATTFALMGAKMSDKFYVYSNSPVPRYRWTVPNDILRALARVDELTLEEQNAVKWTCREMQVSADDLLDFDLGNGVRLSELFTLSRLMGFLNGLAAAKLKEEMTSRLDVVLNSMTPAFGKQAFLHLCESVIDADRAKATMDLLTMDESGHIDILYTPLIPAGNSLFVPVHLFSQVNVYRNVLITQQRRMFADGRRDPLSRYVHSSFVSAGAQVKRNIEYSWNEQSGEVDVLALFGDYLFVLECKNSILACGVHELRTSLDHLEKAARQLRRFVECWNSREFRSHLLARLGRTYDTDIHIVPAVIVSNRMFLGLRMNGFPVRGNYELDSFLRTGAVNFCDREKCFWLDSTLSAEDVRRFFEDDITYRPQWDAMESVSSRFSFSECVVIFPRLRLNAIVLAGQLGLYDLKSELMKEAREDGLNVSDDGWEIGDRGGDVVIEPG